jgi:hypothetical protein
VDTTKTKPRIAIVLSGYQFVAVAIDEDCDVYTVDVNLDDEAVYRLTNGKGKLSVSPQMVDGLLAGHKAGHAGAGRTDALLNNSFRLRAN